jgi:Cd2+/Zn2+-exporting ATPase
MLDNKFKAEDFAFDAAKDGIGMSLLFVTEGGKALGWIGLSDHARSDAASSLEELYDSGVAYTAMVSGDRQSVVDVISADMKVTAAMGDCKPEDKVEKVKEIRAKGYSVAFVGDGVNDGPALATSDIGIAMGAAGSDVSLESATIALMNNELNRLPFLVTLSRTMKRTILQNFILGAVFIIGGITLGALGKLEPEIAAILQVIGAVAVVMNSARLIRQGEEVDNQTGSEEEKA